MLVLIITYSANTYSGNWVVNPSSKKAKVLLSKYKFTGLDLKNNALFTL